MADWTIFAFLKFMTGRWRDEIVVVSSSGGKIYLLLVEWDSGAPITQVLTNRIVLSTEIENFPVDSGIYPSSHRGFI